MKYLQWVRDFAHQKISTSEYINLVLTEVQVDLSDTCIDEKGKLYLCHNYIELLTHRDYTEIKNSLTYKYRYLKAMGEDNTSERIKEYHISSMENELSYNELRVYLNHLMKGKRWKTQ